MLQIGLRQDVASRADGNLFLNPWMRNHHGRAFLHNLTDTTRRRKSIRENHPPSASRPCNTIPQSNSSSDRRRVRRARPGKAQLRLKNLSATESPATWAKRHGSCFLRTRSAANCARLDEMYAIPSLRNDFSVSPHRACPDFSRPPFHFHDLVPL